MSKKRFTEGLESLFGPASEEAAPLSSEQVEQPTDKKEKEKPARKKKSSGKNFSNDLQSFLQDAFQDSFDKQLEEKKDAARTASSVNKKRSRKPMAGLDALIRTTIEPSKVHVQDKPVRRLTLSFDEQKLEKLKTIARMERTYLRDIIDDIVKEFIEGYEQKKGGL